MRARFSAPSQFILCLVLGVGAWSCESAEPDITPEMLETLEAERARGAQDWHRGPDVYVSGEGPARYAASLYETFQFSRALGFARYVDGFYRAPANEGYDLSLDRVEQTLRRVGFGGRDGRFELAYLETEMESPAWTPREAQLVLFPVGEAPRVLHAFDRPADADRCMLPVNAPSCEVRGPAALHLEDLRPGGILVTREPLAGVLSVAAEAGAAAVLSSYLAEVNLDPLAGRHRDALRFVSLPPGSILPCAQVSPHSHEAIAAAVGRGGSVELSLEAVVEFEQRPLRTLVAAIRGDERPDEAVVMAAHVQEPGAGDNASGVAGQLEGVLTLSALLRTGSLEWPSRSLVFLWGDEFTQSEAWLAATERSAVAAVSADMTGQSRERTGALALLERGPDPGALRPLPPDEHSEWGARPITADRMVSSGLSVIARCAMIDVGLLAGGAWSTADHPWEGGSDHDVFLDRGIPAVLFWHFTDWTYHTSLDRMGMLDGEELRRTTVAILATALAVADPLPGDLERYTRSIAMEKTVRLAAAEAVGDAELRGLWVEWLDGAREWLRFLCLRLDENGD